MFKSILVANRGEIACRVFRTARAMGIRTIAVYSEADARAKHVREADEAVLIGAAPASESYLRGEKILEAAKQTGAEAIHPGYGFLSENPEFADAVIAAGLIWIGPPPSAIRAMGLKDESKRIAEEAGVPVLSGYRGEDQSEKRLAKAAKDVGFPVLIKAVAGGGGRGIREVRAAEEFSEALASAKREAAAAFGDDRMLVEKLVERPRHIEVQIFGDSHGNLVHLYERDCSLQRRRQKVIEEAPAPGMTDEVRKAMTDAALKVAAAVGYQNAGTVEFVVDGNGPLRPDGFWFMEMNTRLQVEHPVTEEITGLDLVEWQLRVAAGEKLPLKQEDISIDGWAMEARICAEDPAENFRPSVGRLKFLEFKYSARCDSGFDAGDRISPHYDSLLAKVIVHGHQRSGALKSLSMALQYSKMEGVRTNVGFLTRCLDNDAFESGVVHTGIIEDSKAELVSPPSEVLAILPAVAAYGLLGIEEVRLGAHDPWQKSDGFRVNARPCCAAVLQDRDGVVHDIQLETFGSGLRTRINGKDHLIEGLRRKADRLDGEVNDVAFSIGAPWLFEEPERRSITLAIDGDAYHFGPPTFDNDHAGEASDVITAPLPGKVVALSAKAGSSVKRGDPLVTLEAMKMEHALKAPRDGVVAETPVSVGALVKEGQALVRLEPLGDKSADAS